jgi:hypothetical protein
MRKGARERGLGGVHWWAPTPTVPRLSQAFVFGPSGCVCGSCSSLWKCLRWPRGQTNGHLETNQKAGLFRPAWTLDVLVAPGARVPSPICRLLQRNERRSHAATQTHTRTFTVVCTVLKSITIHTHPPTLSPSHCSHYASSSNSSLLITVRYLKRCSQVLREDHKHPPILGSSQFWCCACFEHSFQQSVSNRPPSLSLSSRASRTRESAARHNTY